MNVLVTNAKNRIAYNIVKSLFLKGHNVYCADFVPRAMSYVSRYSSGHFIYPSPFRRQKEFVECLLDKIKELNIDVFIPVFEELFLVAKYKDIFSQNVKLAIPAYDQILIAHNKDHWEPIAKQLGIPVPETFSVDQLKADPVLIKNVEFPVLLKPKQGGGGWGIGEVGSSDELANIVKAGKFKGNNLSRYIVQRKVLGETICVAMVFSKGQLRGKSSYQQIREYPAFSGQATCRISISNKVAEGYLQKLLEHLSWHGVCQVDFVVEEESGNPYLIDINPRFWGSLVQGIASGVDFPYLICEIAAHGDVLPVEGFEQGVQTRWLGGELAGLYGHMARSDNKLTFMHNFMWPKIKTVQFDDFNFTDPFPFGVWCWDSLCRLARFNGGGPHDSLDGVWD